EHWIATQEDMFQGSVTLGKHYRLWWSYIPHFLHTPGYVYAYAFGELLVLALYARYRENAVDFPERYLSLLEAGGSDWPHVLLRRMEVDLTDPGFWSQGLMAIEELIGQAETLAAEVEGARTESVCAVPADSETPRSAGRPGVTSCGSPCDDPCRRLYRYSPPDHRGAHSAAGWLHDGGGGHPYRISAGIHLHQSPRRREYGRRGHASGCRSARRQGDRAAAHREAQCPV